MKLERGRLLSSIVSRDVRVRISQISVGGMPAFYIQVFINEEEKESLSYIGKDSFRTAAEGYWSMQKKYIGVIVDYYGEGR